MGICATSDRLGISLARQASRLSAVGGPNVAQALSSYVGELPPLDSFGSGNRLSRSSVEAFGGLYYYGELEETSLITLAELVVEERYALNITDQSLFQALEEMAAQMSRGWYNQQRRNTIFTQMLGFGSSNDVRVHLGGVVDALNKFEQSARYGNPPMSKVAAVEFAFSSMISALGARAGLGLERAAQVLNGQLRTALAVIGNDALHRVFRVRDMWDFVRTVAVTPQGQQPDTTSIVDRAQSGAAIIGWAAGRLKEISSRNGSLQTALLNDATVFRQARRWAMGAQSLQQPSVYGRQQPGGNWFTQQQPGANWGGYHPSGGHGGGWA